MMEGGKYAKEEGEKKEGVAEVWWRSDWKHDAAVFEILKEYILCSLLKISKQGKNPQERALDSSAWHVCDIPE